MNKRLNRNSGFSLLEILIVVALMGAIAVIASQAIKNGLNTKKKLDARLRVESMIFDALRVISTDIERAFHYQFALYEIDRASLASQKPAAPQPGQPPVANVDPTAQMPPPARLTNLIGKENSLHFTTLNHYRTTANSQESDQIEVGYYIENCKSRATRKESRCLWRRSSTSIDDDVTRGGDATPIVENVGQFKLEYLSEDVNIKEWRSEWVTDRNGNAQTRNLFPAMIKITISIDTDKDKNLPRFSQTIIASVRTPNNVDPAKRFGSQQQQQNPNAPPPPGGPMDIDADGG